MNRTSLKGVVSVALSVLTAGACVPIAYAGDGPRLMRLIDIESAAFDGLVATPNGAKLYVTVRIDNPLRFQVITIDTRTDEILNRIDIGQEGVDGSSAREVLMSPHGDRVYVKTPLDNIIAIDVETDELIGRVHFGRPQSRYSSRDIEISRDGTKLYVANFSGDELTVVDALALEVSHRIPVPGYVNGLVQSKTGHQVYVLSSNRGDNESPEPVLVSVVDTEKLEVVSIIPAGRGFWANSIISGRATSDVGLPGDPLLYVSAGSSEVVSVIDLTQEREIEQVEVGLYGEEIDLAHKIPQLWFFRNAYVTNGSIDVINTDSLEIVGNIPQGGMENGQLGRFMQKYTVFTPDDRYAIVPQFFIGSIWVTDVEKGEVIDRFQTGGNPTCLYYLPDAEKAYVSARNGRSYTATTGKLAVISLTGDSPCNALERHTAKGLDSRIRSKVFTSLRSGDVTVACELDGEVASRQVRIPSSGRAKVRLKRLPAGVYTCSVTEIRDENEVHCDGLLLPVGATVR